MRFFPFDFAQG